MPDWTYNSITIKKGRSSDENWKYIVDTFNESEEGGVFGLMEKFLPQPEDIGDAWYEWRINHWGTKWDIAVTDLAHEDESISFSEQTAWAPPSSFLRFLCHKFGLDIRNEYNDGGTNHIWENDRTTTEFHNVMVLVPLLSNKDKLSDQSWSLITDHDGVWFTKTYIASTVNYVFDKIMRDIVIQPDILAKILDDEDNCRPRALASRRANYQFERTTEGILESFLFMIENIDFLEFTEALNKHSEDIRVSYLGVFYEEGES